MEHFELVSEYAPTGDQPQAIEQLVKGFQEGNQCQTLLGVTGSGKTFTMANVIREFDSCILEKVVAGIDLPAFFVSNFMFYLVVINGNSIENMIY